MRSAALAITLKNYQVRSRRRWSRWFWTRHLRPFCQSWPPWMAWLLQSSFQASNFHKIFQNLRFENLKMTCRKLKTKTKWNGIKRLTVNWILLWRQILMKLFLCFLLQNIEKISPEILLGVWFSLNKSVRRKSAWVKEDSHTCLLFAVHRGLWLWKRFRGFFAQRVFQNTRRTTTTTQQTRPRHPGGPTLMSSGAGEVPEHFDGKWLDVAFEEAAKALAEGEVKMYPMLFCLLWSSSGPSVFCKTTGPYLKHS